MRSLLLLFTLPAFGATDIATRLNWLLNDPLVGLSKYESASPPTLDSAKLGRLLFYDKRLSKDGTISCATCHQVEHGYSSITAVATGIAGLQGTRKPPPILNKAFGGPFFWDGRADTLEAQASGPLFHPAEMGTTEAELVAKLESIQGYRKLFQEPISLSSVTRAIADFERTLMSGNSLFDRWQADPTVIYPETAQRGFDLYKDRSCNECHGAPLFTDNQFHNTGVGFANGAFKDEGRSKISGHEEDTGSFKTPTLRNLLSHAPYMHDGSIATLPELIDFYNKAGHANPHLDEKIIPLGLQPGEKVALVDFLKTLEGIGFEETPPTPDEFPL